ncbi:MAG: flagellar basal-body rod protein FlgF [Gammaproteobacteria bacterium]|jgi:flagellar basal-body rod protein FlgF|nr:flagellar basal-body rod protein FlgF [Gammaproteobacteria bacterium]
MDRMLYLAASGASQIQRAQAVNANNLANVGTTGFKAQFEALRAVPLYGPGHASRVYALSETPGIDMSSGSLQSTGRNLDIAVNGRGLIAIQAPDGSEAYTRAGDLRVSATGILETGAGHPVLGDAGPISIPDAQELEIAADGTISVLPVGQAPSTMAVVGRIKLVAPPEEQLVKGEDGLLRLQDSNVANPDAGVRVVSGTLETSNVSSVEALTTMIHLARQYETQVKLMKTAEENDAASAKLMSIS